MSIEWLAASGRRVNACLTEEEPFVRPDPDSLEAGRENQTKKERKTLQERYGLFVAIYIAGIIMSIGFDSGWVLIMHMLTGPSALVSFIFFVWDTLASLHSNKWRRYVAYTTIIAACFGAWTTDYFLGIATD